MHAQFQLCWHQKELEPQRMAIINSIEKNHIYNFSKMKNSVYNLIGLEDYSVGFLHM